MRFTRHTVFLTLTAVLLAPAAHAQDRSNSRLLGKIESINGTAMTVKTATAVKEVNLLPTAKVYAQVKATLADIKPGVFVGVGAMPQEDGSQQAIRVMIFPEAMRGQGEGHRPWDRPGTTMTNATVETAVTNVSGQALMVKYKDGEKKILVKPGAEILTYVDGDRKELKPGVTITASGSVKAGGAMDADRIVVTR